MGNAQHMGCAELKERRHAGSVPCLSCQLFELYASTPAMFADFRFLGRHPRVR